MAKWGKVDFKEIEAFKNRLEKLEKGANEALIETIAKELASRLLSKVIKRTPVGQYPESGKMGGTLRRGWTSKSEREAELNAVFGGRSAVKSYVDELVVTKLGDVYEIQIINPVMYASYVEFGHRTANGSGWVEGQFMLTISEKELDAQAPAIIERRIKKALEEVFK